MNKEKQSIIYQLVDKEWLLKQYWGYKNSIGDIATFLGVTRRAVRLWMRKVGIPRRTISEGKKEYHKKNPGIMVEQRKYGQPGKRNAMYGLREGDHPAWRGGGRKSYYNNGYRAWGEFWREEPPQGYIIHHVDGNIANDHVSNLALITHRTHALVHDYCSHFGGR